MTPDSQALGDGKKFRGGMRAAQAFLKASKAELAAEMAALSAQVTQLIQQSRDIPDARSPPATPTDKSDRDGGVPGIAESFVPGGQSDDFSAAASASNFAASSCKASIACR